jgi:hypothetical protein
LVCAPEGTVAIGLAELSVMRLATSRLAAFSSIGAARTDQPADSTSSATLTINPRTHFAGICRSLRR